MATKETYHDPKNAVSFTKPTIARKAYVAVGPSGWPEHFDRAQADQALATCLAPSDVDEIVNNFLVQQQVGRHASRRHLEATWGEIEHYMTGAVAGKPMPASAVIAFWAKVILRVKEIEAAHKAEHG